MIRCYVGGALFRVSFHHRDNQDERALSKKKTICYIYEGREDFATWTGVASCSKKDNFCRETGRKLALARAIGAWPKSARRELWEGYFKRGSTRPEAPVHARVAPPGPEMGASAVM